MSLDNTLDGTTADSVGNFNFTTTEKGAQTLVATALGYSNGGMPVNVDADVKDAVIKLKNTSRELDAVVITAGSIEADDRRKTVLKAMDVVTTAGANADIIKAIQTLPGTQQQGTETGLFVRGGDASESSVTVDELTVQNAFFSAAPGVAARSRFNPFQYKGIAFSSGGYSARYGQALSSVLELNTLDLPDKSNVNLGINMAGVYASGDKLYKNSAWELGGSYTNLQPFYGLAKSNVDYYKVPRGTSLSGKYTWKPNKDGIVKVLVNGSYFESGVVVPSPFIADTTLNFAIKNTNIYSNISYRQYINAKWSLFTAASYSYNKDDIMYGMYPQWERTSVLQQGLRRSIL